MKKPKYKLREVLSGIFFATFGICFSIFVLGFFYGIIQIYLGDGLSHGYAAFVGCALAGFVFSLVALKLLSKFKFVEEENEKTKI